jgi:integrase
MGRPILTEVAVRRMHPPPAGRLEVWDAALPAFGLRITATGARSFVLLTRLHGRPIRLTWRWPATSLATARDLAREALQAIARGEDPRRRKGGADTFAATAAAFIAKYARPTKKTWDEDERKLRVYVTPRWGSRRLEQIGRQDVVALMDHIAEEHGPVMANRVLAVVKTLFSWALNRGLITAHPAAGLAAPGVERQRDRVLTDEEIARLWPVWTAMGYPFGTASQLVLLTAARRGEVGHMEWAELDLPGRCWEIPAARSKTGTPLVLPLSPPAVALLAALPRLDGCPFVFTTRGRKPIEKWEAAVAQASTRARVSGWTAHDLRRTVRTGLSKLGVPPDIGERVLGHTLGGVRGTYDRYGYLAEKRHALEKWADHLDSLSKKV